MQSEILQPRSYHFQPLCIRKQLSVRHLVTYTIRCMIYCSVYSDQNEVSLNFAERQRPILRLFRLYQISSSPL